MKTTDDLIQRAKNAIERREACAYEVAQDHNQMIENVAHMAWFIREVACWFTLKVNRYSHLRGRCLRMVRVR